MINHVFGLPRQTETAFHTTALLCVVVLAATGCGQRTEKSAEKSAVAPSSQQSRVPPASGSVAAVSPDVADATAWRGLRQKIKFKTDDGKTAFSIKPKDDGAKLVDANEKEMARFNIDDNKLKIKDPDDKVLGYIVASDGQYKIKDARQEIELWEFQRQDDGDWKLKNGQDDLIYKIKVRDYGFEVEDNEEVSLFKAKLKDGKTSLRDAAEKTVWSTRDSLPTIAVACLGCEAIEQLELRSALATFLVIRSENERQ